MKKRRDLLILLFSTYRSEHLTGGHFNAREMSADRFWAVLRQALGLSLRYM